MAFLPHNTSNLLMMHLIFLFFFMCLESAGKGLEQRLMHVFIRVDRFPGKRRMGAEIVSSASDQVAPAITLSQRVFLTQGKE